MRTNAPSRVNLTQPNNVVLVRKHRELGACHIRGSAEQRHRWLFCHLCRLRFASTATLLGGAAAAQAAVTCLRLHLVGADRCLCSQVIHSPD